MESAIQTSQAVGASNPKPTLAPKPRLTPKPFSLQKNTTIRSIHAPKTVAKTITANQTGKSEATGVPKPTLTTHAQKPPQQTTTSDSKASSVSVQPKDKPKTTTESKASAHEEDTPDSTVAPGKSEPVSQTPPPKETPKDEPLQKDDVIQTNHKASMDFVTNSEQKDGEKKENATQAFVVQKPEESGSDGSSTVNATCRWGGTRKNLPVELTSKFESGGPSLPPQPTRTESTGSTKDLNKPASSEPEQIQTTTEPSNRESDEGGPKEDYSGGGSIKRRISLLFDSPLKPEVGTKKEEPEIVNSTGCVKERIKHWAVETSSPGPKTAKKPQVAPRPRSRSFEPATSPSTEKTPTTSLVKPSLTRSSSIQAVDPRSEVSPAEPPSDSSEETSKELPTEKKSLNSWSETMGEDKQNKSTEGEDRPRSRSSSTTQTDQGDSTSSESAQRALKRDNVKRRSVRFGTVERDDGGPPVSLGSPSESSSEEEEEEAPEDKTEEDTPVSVPVYKRVGIFQKKDEEIHKQEEEQLKHLEFEQRRRAEENEQARLKLEEERKREDEEREKENVREQEELRLREEQKLREEEKERERLKEEEMERQRLREEERKRLQEEMEREREIEKEERLKQDEREKERLREEAEEKERERQRILKEEERMRERQRQGEEDRKRREHERKMQQEKEEEMERMRQIEKQREEEEREEERKRQMEKERLEELEKKIEEELERKQEKELEMLKMDEERGREELGLTNREQESTVDESNLISFDSDDETQKSETPHSPYEPTESQIEVVYDDFSVRKPLIEVEFDDFSVKSKRWGSQAKAETSPVVQSWAASPVDKDEVEELVSLRPEQDSPEPTPTMESPEKEEVEERPEEEQLISTEVEGEEEEEEVDEMEREEEVDESEEEDNQKVQVNSYCISGGDKDTDALIDSEPDQQNGGRDQTSDNDSPKPIPDQVLEASSQDADTTDLHREPEFAPFPESSAPLLDTSAQRSKADVGKRRIRTRPSRSLRAGLSQRESPDWRAHDSTDGKEASPKRRESDSEEEEPKPKICPPPPTSQRVPVFPGLSPTDFIAQLKKRTAVGGEETEEDKGREEKGSQHEETAPAPSPRSAAHLAGAARVLPPLGGTDSGANSAPEWLKELKSKKRLSQHDSEA
ncbi:182 kDa tankyrase-1-binding protein [Toxotes jaculatrix]|uniref:182 kDa tankyrase-1-binding protein n=1 Tax=Toxotes jaculatrix TaxID=941984 RepID=UPI001B3AF606|nr:182 kDa tankyrase-1-binding protein [Toxotes jaculatrix]